MEDLTLYTTILKNLRYQARELTSASLSLTILCDQEAIQLNRKDEASRLKALSSSVRQQLDQAKSDEDAANYSHSQTDMIVSLGGLAATSIIKMVSKNKWLPAFSDHLFDSLTNEQRPFGMVLVCIGVKGLPDDVGVVSISRLARDSNRKESEVINELRERGSVLFDEKVFLPLIDKLINGIQEGRLLLPISAEKLTQIKT